MTQQHINLLRKERLAPPSLLWGGAALLLFMGGLGGYGAVLHRDNTQAQAGVRAQEAELAALRLAVGRAGQPSQSLAAVQAEVERLRPLARAYAPLVEQVGGGGLGLATGYLPHFTTLAQTVDPTVWLTQVSLGDAGRRLSLQGQAVDEKAVLNYVDRLNQAYRGQGLAFVSLDLVVDPPAPAPAPATPGGTAPPRPRTVSFRLN